MEAIGKLQDNLGALQGIVSDLQVIVGLEQKMRAHLQARVKRLESRPVCIEMPRLDAAMTEAVKAQAAKAKEN
jgi:hypothetical protein